MLAEKRPPSAMTPETSVLAFVPPTLTASEPKLKVPAPAMDPRAWSGCDNKLRSMVPPALATKVAEPEVTKSLSKTIKPPEFAVKVAVPASDPSLKVTAPPLSAVTLAEPAEPLLANLISLLPLVAVTTTSASEPPVIVSSPLLPVTWNVCVTPLLFVMPEPMFN